MFWRHGSDVAPIDRLSNRTLLIDVHAMPVLKELVAYLVIERLYKEMALLPDSPVRDGRRTIRSILVIDEAHNYLSQRNIFLQRIIREGRSKGIVVFFASQSPNDYQQKFFNFQELLEFAFIFQCEGVSAASVQDILGCSNKTAKDLANRDRTPGTLAGGGPQSGKNRGVREIHGGGFLQELLDFDTREHSMMDHLNDLRTRVENAISELSDIIQDLERYIGDPENAVSFGQVKEIEASITRLKKQGLPITTELKELKLNLLSKHERHKERIALYQEIQEGIGEILNRATLRLPKRTQVGYPKVISSPHRKPSNYEKPLGSKGYSNLRDYLIPVIKLMWSGLDHKEAFRNIAHNLDVRYNTVSSQCTRALSLTTEEFIGKVSSKTIVEHLENKYPDDFLTIKIHLKK